MIKKITLLAMALGALAAFVLPASASAAWKHHDTAIQVDKTIGLTSTTNIAFKSHSLGGLNCQVTSSVKFTAGQTTGLIESFTPHPTSDTANCKGEGGFAFCQVHNLTPTGLPHPAGTQHVGPGWTIHTTGTAALPTIQITYGEIHSQVTGAFCPAGSVTVTEGTATAIPTNASGVQQNGKTVQHVTIQGTASVHSVAGADPNATVHGFFHVESPNSNTYSF